MFDLRQYLEGLDLLYSSGQGNEAEAYLKKGLKQAAAAGENGSILAILNELMGYYRAAGRYEECLLCADQAMELADAMGLSGTMEYGTMLLNVATGYRAAGNYAEAEALYRQAHLIFRKHVTGPDYRMASLHNNLSLLYSETGRLDEAKQELELAMDIIRKLDDAEIEVAITHTKQNLSLVSDLLGRKQAAEKSKMKGMELARAYYEKYGKPMIEMKFPDYAGRIAAGLCGEGSECLGYDDVLSTDHDFGPGFCLWLTKKDYRKIGARLQEAYEALPKEFLGYKARNTTSHGQKRVGVFEIGAFFEELTGYRKAPEDDESWLSITQENLRTATNGEVFDDPLGKFSKRREGFLREPETVRLKRLCLSLGRMAQAGQYNFPRAKRREAIGAMYFSLSEFIQASTETAYLLNETYMPFYKWKIRGMETFRRIPELCTLLEELMQKDLRDTGVEKIIEQICRMVVGELNAQGISDRKEVFLEEQKGAVFERLVLMERKKGQKDD